MAGRVEPGSEAQRLTCRAKRFAMRSSISAGGYFTSATRFRARSTCSGREAGSSLSRCSKARVRSKDTVSPAGAAAAWRRTVELSPASNFRLGLNSISIGLSLFWQAIFAYYATHVNNRRANRKLKLNFIVPAAAQRGLPANIVQIGMGSAPSSNHRL